MNNDTTFLRAAEIIGGADALIIAAGAGIGAGSHIPSVRQFSQRMSQKYGGRIVRINPREFSVPSSMDVAIPMGALEALKGIRASMQNSGRSC